MMIGTSNRATKASALGVFGFLALLVGSIITPGASANAQPAQRMAQATPVNPAPTTAGQPARSSIKEVEARITELHSQLHVTLEQEPQFKAYADVLRANAQTMQGLFEERAKETGTSATARLHWYARLTTTHAENINKLVPVFDALYQTLSESQKKAADAAFEQLRQRRAARRAQ